MFGEETAKSLVEKYRIGTTKDGYAVFYQSTSGTGACGEHLLPLCPKLPVALVEDEKTAVICSAVFPEFLWLAPADSASSTTA